MLIATAANIEIRPSPAHNDEMALRALRVIAKARKQKQILVGGVDGLVDACAAVARGDMAGTVINPTGRIHSGALWIGYFLATQGERANVPEFIRIDGGIVNKDTAPHPVDARCQNDHALCV